MNKRWQWTGQSMTCQFPSSVHAPSSTFLTPPSSCGAPVNAFPWPRHASPVNTGAEHFMTLAYYAQQQWTEERDTSWPRKSMCRSSRASGELDMNMNMEHEQKMAMDRAEHDLRMSIMLQCVAAYGGSKI